MIPTNRVILTGKVAKPPQRYFRPDGSVAIQFPLELDDPGNPPTRSGRNWIDIVAFGPLAEREFDRLQSSPHLHVEGQLKKRHWKTPEGRTRERLEVIATDFRTIEEAQGNER